MSRPRVLLAGVSLLAVCLCGCAAGGGRTRSLRPAFGGLPSIQPGVPVQPHSSSQMMIQPGTTLEPTPALPAGPTIQPGPALPDASGRKWPAPYPESASTNRPSSRRHLPSIVPHPEPGAPIARSQTPAALSGQIEIIPGPAIRAHKPRLEILPPPTDHQPVSVELLPPPE